MSGSFRKFYSLKTYTLNCLHGYTRHKSVQSNPIHTRIPKYEAIWCQFYLYMLSIILSITAKY